MAKVAWIGLGVMGYPMAGHILRKGGHELTVYNRTAAKAAAWVSEYGTGSTAPTPADAARDADFVFACVGNDDDLRAVTLGAEGAFATMKPGAIFIDNTTASAEVARDLYAAGKEKGIGFLDAPVSGGQAGAQNGALTVMVGGDEDRIRARATGHRAFAQAWHPDRTGGRRATDQDGQPDLHRRPRSGARGSHPLRPRGGARCRPVMESISKGAAQSWQMENRWKTMAAGKFDFGFAVDWMRKDLSIVLDEARSNGARLPVTAVVDQFYAEVQGWAVNAGTLRA